MTIQSILNSNKIILIVLMLFIIPMYYYPLSYDGVHYLDSTLGLHFNGFSDGHSKSILNSETPEQNYQNLINYIKEINN